jgi:hypothetical protein
LCDVLLEVKIAVDGDKNIKTLSREFEQLPVLFASPAGLLNG